VNFTFFADQSLHHGNKEIGNFSYFCKTSVGNNCSLDAAWCFRLCCDC